MIETVSLSNAAGTSLDVITVGAAITALRVADRDGNIEDIVLGFDEPDQYLDNPNYFGVVVGRFANRIAQGRFQIDNRAYQVAQNQGDNHLHGGPTGFHLREWSVADSGDTRPENAITLNYRSLDGEEQFPGNLDVSVTYRLTDANELVIDYSASTDKPTILNLTQHSYFNLAGHASGSILDHELCIHADRYTPQRPDQIPTGEIAPLDNTPLDLRTPARIGDVLSQSHQQLTYGGGLDHNYVLKDAFDATLQLVAEVREPVSGRVMRVLTDQPGMQAYTGNFIGEGCAGKDGATYGPHQGLCLETQHFSDAPNHSNFPSTLLLPGQVFASRTVYQFGIG